MERQLRHSVRHSCVQRGSTCLTGAGRKAQTGGISAAKRGTAVKHKGQPSPLLLPSGQPLGHSFCTQGKINALCWETPRSREQRQVSLQSTERAQQQNSVSRETSAECPDAFPWLWVFQRAGRKEKEVLIQQISWTFFQGRSSALIRSWLLVTSSESPPGHGSKGLEDEMCKLVVREGTSASIPSGPSGCSGPLLPHPSLQQTFETPGNRL